MIDDRCLCNGVGRDLGSACSEQDFENFIAGRVALLDYSNTDCSLYDKVVFYQGVCHSYKSSTRFQNN